MANIQIIDLYLRDEKFIIHEIADREIKSVTGGQITRGVSNTNDMNEESLVNTFAQNLDGLLWNLRSQMNATISTAGNRVGSSLDFLI
ncbi:MULTISPECIES: hypothetical protein [unclassified Anabaena]|uniref:hypothetical protein n=1 Tax=unclassified Anabaena TaxID=2619674 RepID=UPI0039C5E8F6